MDDKDKLYSIGKSEMFVKPWDAPDGEYKQKPILENTLSFETYEDEKPQTDYSNLTQGTWNFTFNPKSRKDKILFHWFVFGGRKPYGLKYPRRKRKIRILSKWINRYMHAYNYEK